MGRQAKFKAARKWYRVKRPLWRNNRDAMKVWVHLAGDRGIKVPRVT